MKKIIVSMAAGAALVAGASTAFAADAIPAPPPEPIAPPVTEFAPSSDWSGIYVGAFGGYNFGTFDAGAPVGDIDADGAIAGGFAGINLQNGAFVYGIEGDVGYSWVDGTDAGTGAVADQRWFSSLRARIGYDFNPFMLYATGGAAATNVEVTQGGVSDSNTHFGWTVGAGADVAFTENVFGRLEYRYTDYQTKTFNVGAGAVDSGLTENSIRAGFGLKF